MPKICTLVKLLLCLTIVCLIVSSVRGQEKKDSSSAPLPPSVAKAQPKPKPVFSPQLSVTHLEAEITFQRSAVAQHITTKSVVENGNHHEMWGYKDAYLFWLRQRSFPNDTIDWTAYVRAFAHQAVMFKAMIRVPRALPGVLSVQPPRWEFLGPTYLPVPYRQYYGEGFTSGRVNGVAFDPTDDKTIYLAAAGGGLWKTTDKGQTWTPLSDGDLWDNTKVSSVVIDPNNPQTVYVGTGDFDGGVGVYGFGIMKSTNGGKDWTNVARQELKGFSVRRILIDPDDSRVITVAAGHNPTLPGKLLRSEDQGKSWKAIEMAGISGAADADWDDIKCGAKTGGSVRSCYVVGASDNGGQVLRTSDEGSHWVKLHPPLRPEYQGSLAVAASPTTPGTVYLLSGTDSAVLKSTDDGDSWTNFTNNLPTGNEIPEIKEFKENYNWSQSQYDFFIESSKRSDTGQDVVYVGLIDLVASSDSGNTWTSVGHTYDKSRAVTHNDQHCLAINPGNPNEVLLGNDGGVYLITYDPSQDLWTFDTSMSAQLGLTQFYSIAADPTSSRIVLGGAQDNATPIALGDFSKWSNVGGGDGGYVAVNPSQTDIQYATSQYLTIYETKKSWRDWDPDHSNNSDISYSDVVNGQSVRWSGDPVSFIAPIALDPKNPNVLYAGTNFLWRRTEAAGTGKWEPHLGSQMLAEKSADSVPIIEKDALSVIAVAPSDSNTIYTGSQNGELWTSNDGGKRWRNVSGVLSGLPRFSITSIAVHPSNPRTIIVGLSGTAGSDSEHPGHLWKCRSTSLRFACQNLTGVGAGMLPNIPVNSAVIDPTSPDKVLYVATDIGVFVSKDGGSTWGDATKPLGLPNVQVNDLKLVPETDYLLAATFGRGAWRIKGLREASLQPRVSKPALHRQRLSATLKPAPQ